MVRLSIILLSFTSMTLCYSQSVFNFPTSRHAEKSLFAHGKLYSFFGTHDETIESSTDGESWVVEDLFDHLNDAYARNFLLWQGDPIVFGSDGDDFFLLRYQENNEKDTVMSDPYFSQYIYDRYDCSSNTTSSTTTFAEGLDGALHMVGASVGWPGNVGTTFMYQIKGEDTLFHCLEESSRNFFSQIEFVNEDVFWMKNSSIDHFGEAVWVFQDDTLRPYGEMYQVDPLIDSLNPHNIHVNAGEVLACGFDDGAKAFSVFLRDDENTWSELAVPESWSQAKENYSLHLEAGSSGEYWFYFTGVNVQPKGVFSWKKGEWSHINHDSGLISDETNDIHYDEVNQGVWVSTDMGISFVGENNPFDAVGVEEEQLPELVVWPVPASQELHIKLSPEMTSFSIHDLAGRMVKQKVISETISIKSLGHGGYYLSIFSGDELVSRRLIFVK